jgi:hypothetical protein
VTRLLSSARSGMSFNAPAQKAPSCRAWRRRNARGRRHPVSAWRRRGDRRCVAQLGADRQAGRLHPARMARPCTPKASRREPATKPGPARARPRRNASRQPMIALQIVADEGSCRSRRR